MSSQSKTLRHAMHAICSAHIDHLLRASDGMTGVLVSSVDGFEVASNLPESFNPATLAAMASSQLAVSDAICAQSNVGACHNVVIEAQMGRVLMMSIPLVQPPLLLIAVCDNKGLLGQLLWAVRACAKDISLQLSDQRFVHA